MKQHLCPAERQRVAAPSRPSTACLILAGGRSQRMGYDKALLPFPAAEAKDQTFLGRLAHLALALTPEVLVVVRDQCTAARYADYLPPAVRLVVDLVPDQGPLMGLYSGLLALQAPQAVALAVDLPLLRSQLLAWLLALPAHDQRLYVPLIEQRPQVLLARYPRFLVSTIAALLARGQRNPRSLLTVAPVRWLSEEELRPLDPDLCSFLNVNTLQDWQLLEERLSQ
ncbi:molybdenum cofactor guanylyltransferase [Thermogemmatispora carboxidivorans]|uniref:molybdenum cofactor guanylyltransferase n=1 Tax=Thermogemmatispora carboxidivorans TaxID=1382306 RepID=UPI00069C9E09|nr:molybdenum cofactor guanylyltransferase [Thermogemmatispora carboxidivorans]